MNNFFGTRIIFSAEKGMTTLTLPRSFGERFFSFPWKPWVTHKTVTAPGMYREGDVIYVHPSLCEEIYKTMNQDEDAPTLKVKAVK